MIKAIAATAALMTVAGTAQAQELNLALQCDGFGDSDTATFIDRTDGTTPAIINGSRRTGERVVIVFDGEAGRVRMPPALQPNIRGRSEDGWRPLSEIEVSDDRITARFSFNFIDKPSIRIDRVTGMVEIRGMAFNFQGECQPYDAEVRRF